MPDNPPAALLVSEVRKALEGGIAPGFTQKVAANALGIAQRELERGPPTSEAEIIRMCEAVRAGIIDEALIGDLIALAIAKLEIDQPSYPAYREWKDKL